MSIDAMKQALADLKLIAAQDQGCGGNVTEADAFRSAKSIAYTAIAALRLAIEQAEKQEPAPGYCKHCKQYTIEEPLPAPPQQEKQEPDPCKDGSCDCCWAEKPEPGAMRYDFDGYGYKYIDSGSGSDWKTRHKGAEPLYEAPPKQEKQEPVCDKDPQGCWNVRCQLGKVCKNAAPPQRQPLIDSVREMRDVQGQDGTWNYDPYMHGLYNGLEVAVSLLEQREPQFKDAPEKWLCDLPKPRIFSDAHGIGGGE